MEIPARGCAVLQRADEQGRRPYEDPLDRKFIIISSAWLGLQHHFQHANEIIQAHEFPGNVNRGEEEADTLATVNLRDFPDDLHRILKIRPWEMGMTVKELIRRGYR